jgi:16S rRNA (uracil1498-N3)-methyltransferase
MTSVAPEVGVGDRLALGEEDSRHLLTVLRLRPGQSFRLCDGQGREWRALVLASSSGRNKLTLCEAQLEESLPAMPEPGLKLELGVAVARGDRLERLIEKAAELGVWRLCPMLTERTTVGLSSDGGVQKLQRWQRIARESSALAGRSYALEVSPLLPFSEILARGTGFLFTGDSPFWEAGMRLPSPCTLLIGPEGGFTSAEIEAATALGWGRLSLGPRTLRVETATVAAATLAFWLNGDLGRGG